MAADLFERRWGWWLRTRRRTRVALGVQWLVPIVCIGIAVWGGHQTMVKLPRDYSALERRGAPAIARFAGCTGGRDNRCTLRLPGDAAAWDYHQDVGQFDGLMLGAPVEVVVDPEDPSRRFTAADVRRRTNAGVGVLFGFSLIMGIAGVVAAAYLVRFARLALETAGKTEARRRDGGRPRSA
jgi:hypothetical protein